MTALGAAVVLAVLPVVEDVEGLLFGWSDVPLVVFSMAPGLCMAESAESIEVPIISVNNKT